MEGLKELQEGLARQLPICGVLNRYGRFKARILKKFQSPRAAISTGAIALHQGRLWRVRTSMGYH